MTDQTPNVVPIEAHLAYRWKTRPIQIPESFALAQEVIGLRAQRTPLGFEFRRRRIGYEVWVVFREGLHLNLSCDGALPPLKLDAARAWAVEFARQHGVPTKEVRRQNRPQPPRQPQCESCQREGRATRCSKCPKFAEVSQ